MTVYKKKPVEKKSLFCGKHCLIVNKTCSFQNYASLITLNILSTKRMTV